VVATQPGATAHVVAQPAAQVYTQSNFGTIALSPGFLPDPHVVTGRSGGAQNSQQWASNCRGWVSGTPDHLFRANSHFGNLRVMANSSTDTTLVVRTPSGQYLCNDDSEGTNPLISSSFAPGTYAIWIGSYNQGDSAQYRLGFTELSSTTPSSIGGSAAVTTVSTGSGQSNFGTISLAPGFTPDPHVVNGVSGGAISARQVSSRCRGWISNTPDHVFVATGHYNNLRILARSESDTTLVVADQNDNVWCDDDGGQGTNPLIQRSFAAGTYRVWIGSYRQGENARYSLGFTELNNVNTMSLPSP